ncbi:hypothetical protein HHI36_015171 [Cryptolaemus montrouzieri]|uniref:CCDC92/74 N-terminal domain-containing protein n=1 Tax=Cryptolaemus montrouzieri TaxID=559131 RepID=A0ABD2N553_9CUCU
MRHCGLQRSSYFEGSKKVPLNTVVLPPLSPNFVENGAQLLLVNKSKSNVNGELVAVSRSQDGTPRIFERTAENVRIAQLEQNIKFLQDQHQIMLNDLHNEIEVLRSKNRDLQFQLIFNKISQFLHKPLLRHLLMMNTRFSQVLINLHSHLRFMLNC